MNKLHFFIILMLSFTLAFGQESKKLLSVKDMHTDIDYYYTNLVETHPYPYHVLSKEQWKQKIDSIKSSITAPKTKREFLNIMTELNCYLDAHSRIAAPKKVRKKMAKPLMIPYIEEVGENVCFVDSNGDICTLETLDGKTPKEIKNFVDSRYSFIEPMKNITFLNYIRLYCNNNMITDSVRYTYVDSLGNHYTSSLKREKSDKKYKNSRNLHLVYDTVRSTAVMEVNTFMPSGIRGVLKYRKDVIALFDTLQKRKIDTLFVDVSCNGGGSVALVNWLVGFFMKETSSVYAGTWMQRFSKQRDKKKYDWLVYSDRSQEYIQRKTYFYPSESKPKFTGKVYVVQSRNSFSGAAIFSSLMQTYVKNCEVVGEEGEVKAFYADPLLFSMPKSKLSFTISSMYGSFAGKDKTVGAVPDIPFKIYDPLHIFTITELKQAIKISE